MEKLKKLMMALVTGITFVSPIGEAFAASPPDCIRCNDGWLTKGEWRDHTPQVGVSYGEKLSIVTIQHGYRPFYMRIYNVRTGVTYYDNYSYGASPEHPDIKVPPGVYSMELKCTTGRTKYYDCKASGSFESYKPK